MERASSEQKPGKWRITAIVVVLLLLVLALGRNLDSNQEQSVEQSENTLQLPTQPATMATPISPTSSSIPPGE